MKQTTTSCRFVIVLLALWMLPTLDACRRSRHVPDPAFMTSEQAWRAERLARLTRPDGWLTLVGLYWLKPGENTFGSDGRIIIP